MRSGYLPGVDQVVAGSDPHKQIVVMLLHLFDAGLAHAQTLLVQSITRSVSVAWRQLGGIVRAELGLNTLECRSTRLDFVGARVSQSEACVTCASNIPAPQQAG
jgi:hypothetical protein